MKIRQIMIASLLLFSGTKALAQPERVSVWDGFGDNVYMDAGVGVQALFAPGWQDIAFGKQITPALNLGVGKWITPFWGLHLDVFGYSQNGYRGTPLDKGVEPFSPLNRVDVGYDGSFRYYLRYLGVRADFRLSLLNLITGCEREGALYDGCGQRVDRQLCQSHKGPLYGLGGVECRSECLFRTPGFPQTGDYGTCRGCALPCRYGIGTRS